MSVFLLIVIYILIAGFTYLLNYVIDSIYYKESMESIYRRRLMWLQKEKAIKEYKLWCLDNKKFNTEKKEHAREKSMMRLSLELDHIDSSLFEVQRMLIYNIKDKTSKN